MKIGTDIVEVKRFKKHIVNKNFLNKVFTEKEQEHIFLFKNEQKIAERMAGKFAAKEAISKAFGTGISDDIVLNEIEILPDEKGAPKVKIYGKTKKFFEKLKEKNIEISISNTTNYAQSSCIIF